MNKLFLYLPVCLFCLSACLGRQSAGINQLCSADDIQPCVTAVAQLDTVSVEHKRLLLIRIKNGITGDQPLEGYTLRDLLVDAQIRSGQLQQKMADFKEPLQCTTLTRFNANSTGNSITVTTHFVSSEDLLVGAKGARNNTDFMDLTGEYLFTETTDYDLDVLDKGQVNHTIPFKIIREKLLEDVPDGLFEWSDEQIMDLLVISSRLTIRK